MKNTLLFFAIVLSISLNAQNSSSRKAARTVAKPTTTAVKPEMKTSESESSSEEMNVNRSGNDSKVSAGVEFGGYPSDADVSFINIYGLFSLYFNLSNSFYIAPHFQYKIASTTDYQVMPYQGKNIDLSSFNEYGLGLSMGYRLMPQSKVGITPELKTTYTEYNMQDQAFDNTSNTYISHAFVGLNPRLNFDMKMSDYTSLGLVGGYIYPLYLRGESTPMYNPQTFTYGLNIKYYFAK